MTFGKTMEKVSVGVVTYNNKETIFEALKSVVKNEEVKEVFIVDNASYDGTPQLIAKEFSQAIIIQNKDNHGFGAANNQALKKVIGEFVFLLNPDAKVERGSLEKMTKYMEENPEVGVVGPKLLNTNGSIQKEITKFPNLINQIPILLRLHRLPFFKSIVYPNYDYSKLQEVEHLMGSALLIRKSALDKAGLFDENFFLWFEETDLLKRIKEAGYKIVYFPDAVVTHLVSHSIKKMNPIKRQIIWNRSLSYYFKKHKPFYELLLLQPFLAASFIPAIILFLSKFLSKH